MLKYILKIFISIVILGTVAYQSNFLDEARSYIFPAAPCAEPIPYTLGKFAGEFDITQKYFLSALADAEAIWEEPAGRQLFIYAPDGAGRTLKVNLIYDYRQQATSKLAELGITVKDNRASYDSLKAKFTALKSEYDNKKNDFNARVQAFNKKQNAYEGEVNYWNKRGGAPEGEFKKLERERAELKAQSNVLQKEQARLNGMAEDINAMVVALNRLVATLNLSVEKYNTTNVARGESFEEGVYIQEGLDRQIDIYEFSSRDKLVRVLAHELGHALGLDHVEDPKAIMYRLNQGASLTLSAADLAALSAKCGAE